MRDANLLVSEVLDKVEAKCRPGVSTAELNEVANLLETKRIKRVPVVRDGKVIGIVSRANLVRALVATKIPPSADADGDDRTIRHKLLAELRGQEWAKVWADDIIVRDRIVHIWCSDDRTDDERPQCDG